MKRNCDNCGKEYEADIRNIKRGWGLCCSKSCAASKREKSKPGYDPERVALNDVRRGTRMELTRMNGAFIEEEEQVKDIKYTGIKLLMNGESLFMK